MTAVAVPDDRSRGVAARLFIHDSRLLVVLRRFTIQDLDRSRGHTPTFFATNSGVVPQSRVWLFLQRGNAIRFSRYALRAFHKYRHGDHGMVE